MDGQLKINRIQRLSDFPNVSLSRPAAIELRRTCNFSFEERTSCHVPCESPFLLYAHNHSVDELQSKSIIRWDLLHSLEAGPFFVSVFGQVVVAICSSMVS